MPPTFKNTIKIFIFLAINGAIILTPTATPTPTPSPSPSPSPSITGKECYKNMKAECRKAVFEALCQDFMIPVEAMVKDLCCVDLVRNVHAACITTAMVRDVKKHCKIDKQLMKMRSHQIWMFCMETTVSPGIDELGN